MRIVVNPKYEYLHSWIEQLPATFSSSGEVIYDARNQIRRIIASTEGHPEPLIVKRFHSPFLLNRLIYSYVRKPKAVRSYENAIYLQQHGIGTPEPVAYILCGDHLLDDSYLVTKESRLGHLMRDFTLAYTSDLEQLIRPFARFTARMHEAGALHMDYSPGNILWDICSDDLSNPIQERYRFEIIDLNRMRVGRIVTLRDGAKSMRRICARTSFFRTFAKEYASARGMNADECTRLILHYRDQFWNHGKIANYQYD